MLKSHETDRLILKVLTKDDAALVLSFYEDNKSHFEPWEPQRNKNFYTQPYQKASLTAEYNLIREGKLLRYWVFRKEFPNEIIGSFCFQNFLREPYKSCCLGYKFSHNHLKQGYATEAIAKGIELLFSEQPIHRIEAFVMPDNHPSKRLMKRLTFQCEGISFSYARVNGIWTDHERYSFINPVD